MAVRGGTSIFWPGLKAAQLFEARDLKPTTDLRALLKGLLRDHLRVDERALAESVFPGSADVQPTSGVIRWRALRALLLYSRLNALPRTCSAYAASCLRVASRREEDGLACYMAKNECMQTGVHVGPFSGVHYAGLERR